MEHVLEEQESFKCTYTPTSPELQKTLAAPIEDLLISTMGHASAFLLSCIPYSSLDKIGYVIAEYHGEKKEAFQIYVSKSSPKIVLGIATEAFRPQFSNDTTKILFNLIKCHRVIVLDAIPSMSYVFAQYENNALLCVNNKYCSVPMKSGSRVSSGTCLGGMIGSVLTKCEIKGIACYACLGVMQEYSVSIDSIKIFSSISELVPFLKILSTSPQTKEVIVAINYKLENHLFS